MKNIIAIFHKHRKNLPVDNYPNEHHCQSDKKLSTIKIYQK